MRAMVLAAGYGTRFRPLSERLPKPAAPVLNEPLVRRTLRRLRDQGIREVLVNLHFRPGDVERACRGIPGLRVAFQREQEILGTGGGIKRAEPFFRGETAIVWNGDILFDLDLEKAISFHRRKRAVATMVLRATPQLARYGAVEVDGRGRVVRLLGEPRGRRGRPLMFAGVHLLEPAFFRWLRSEPSCIVRTAYRSLVDRGAPVYGYETGARWLEIGTPEDYLAANLALLGDRVLVGEGARVEAGARLFRSIVGPGARIGAGARIERCVVWPGVKVAPGTRAEGKVIP
jgi:NDP-sugar pyrophosphorylase family protein